MRRFRMRVCWMEEVREGGEFFVSPVLTGQCPAYLPSDASAHGFMI